MQPWRRNESWLCMMMWETRILSRTRPCSHLSSFGSRFPRVNARDLNFALNDLAVTRAQKKKENINKKSPLKKKKKKQELHPFARPNSILLHIILILHILQHARHQTGTASTSSPLTPPSATQNRLPRIFIAISKRITFAFLNSLLAHTRCNLATPTNIHTCIH